MEYVRLLAKTAFAKFLGLDALLALRIRIRECLDEQLCELPIATSPLNLGLAKRDGGGARARDVHGSVSYCEEKQGETQGEDMYGSAAGGAT